jgi:hypothetical protein
MLGAMVQPANTNFFENAEELYFEMANRKHLLNHIMAIYYIIKQGNESHFFTYILCIIM